MTNIYPPMPGLPAPPFPPAQYSGIPPGSVMAFAGQVTETNGNTTVGTTYLETYNWMVCDGRLLVKSQYATLYVALGDQYNQSGDPSDQFRLPDYRGYFLRMVTDGTSNDPDSDQRKLPNGSTSAAVGSFQNFALQTHVHSYNEPGKPTVTSGNGAPSACAAPAPAATGTPASADSFQNPPGTVNVSPNETRPANVYVYYIIKVS